MPPARPSPVAWCREVASPPWRPRSRPSGASGHEEAAPPDLLRYRFPQPLQTKRETALHGIKEHVSTPSGLYYPHSYPRTRLAGAGFGRIRPDVERSQNKEKPAGYQRVIGWFRTVSERSGRPQNGQKVTRRVTQPLASMRVCGHKIGLLPTLLPTSAFWGGRGCWGGRARRASTPPASSPARAALHRSASHGARASPPRGWVDTPSAGATPAVATCATMEVARHPSRVPASEGPLQARPVDVKYQKSNCILREQRGDGQTAQHRLSSA